MPEQKHTKTQIVYTCPIHADVLSDKQGTCPKCGMKLVRQDSISEHSTHQESNNYTPLLVVVFMILLVTLVLTGKDITLQTFALQKSLAYFMIGFFLVFSG